MLVRVRTASAGYTSQGKGGRARRVWLPLLWFLVALFLAACTTATPLPSPTPTPPLPTPTSTPLPTPTPTPTPLPSVPLIVDWPMLVSAMQDVIVQVELPGLGERDPNARVWAWISDSLYRMQWMGDLEPVGGDIYAASAPLHFPLTSREGEWRLNVSILSTARVSGERTIYFRMREVPLRDLTDQVREGVDLLVPLAFSSVRAEGDQVAGGRVWLGGGAELGLWWVPGPTEPLSQDTALMMLHETHFASESVEVLGVESIDWHGLPALRFNERWTGGPAEVLVVQGSDHWLYLLRVRSMNGESPSLLLQEIRDSFRVP